MEHASKHILAVYLLGSKLAIVHSEARLAAGFEFARVTYAERLAISLRPYHRKWISHIPPIGEKGGSVGKVMYFVRVSCASASEQNQR